MSPSTGHHHPALLEIIFHQPSSRFFSLLSPKHVRPLPNRPLLALRRRLAELASALVLDRTHGTATYSRHAHIHILPLPLMPLQRRNAPPSHGPRARAARSADAAQQDAGSGAGGGDFAGRGRAVGGGAGGREGGVQVREGEGVRRCGEGAGGGGGGFGEGVGGGWTGYWGVMLVGGFGWIGRGRTYEALLGFCGGVDWFRMRSDQVWRAWEESLNMVLLDDGLGVAWQKIVVCVE